MTVSIQSEDFDVTRAVAELTGDNGEIGAVATFIGKVRATSNGKALQSMTLEHYPGMTERELERIEEEAARRFGLTASRIIHRVGPLHPGDNIVLVIACAAHRHSALAACDYLMDYLKSQAPFWKKEALTDGSETWVDARESDHTALSRWSSENR